MINLDGLPPEYMLAALYNRSAPQGMGFLAAASAPKTFTAADARRFFGDLLAGKTNRVTFDYLAGRPIKVDFVRDTAGICVERCDLYDRDRGPGAARRAYEDAVETYTAEK